jgi:hypothetical protein
MFNSMTKKSIPPRVIFVLLILAALASLGGLRYAGYHFFPSSKADPHALHTGSPSFPPSPLQLPLAQEISRLKPEALQALQALRFEWVSCQQTLAVAQQSSLEGLPEHKMAAALAAFAESHHEQILKAAALEQQISDFAIENAPDLTALPTLNTPGQASPERSRVATERSRVVTERSRFSPIREALVNDGLSLEEAEARWPAPPLIP